LDRLRGLLRLLLRLKRLLLRLRCLIGLLLRRLHPLLRGLRGTLSCLGGLAFVFLRLTEEALLVLPSTLDRIRTSSHGLCRALAPL
jgi:hypothetical protein